MAQMNIKQIRGASQGSILFLGTNSVVSENFDNLRWEQNSNKLVVNGNFQYIDGSQQPGYVLTTDGTGLATWSQSIVATQSIVEIPISGTQNGTNKNFILAYSLSYPSNLFFINGQLVQSPQDYIISGTALTIDSIRPAPTPTDTLRLFGAATGIGTGIQELNGLTSLNQTFTTYTDSNLTYSINSSGSNHEFNIKLSDDVIVTGTFSVGSVYSDLIPTFDSQYDLGSSSSQWRSLHVASGSVYVGGVTISSDNDAISINKLNLGTEGNPSILTGSGSNIFVNGTIFSSSADIQTLIVAKDGAEFTSIKTAIESITDATSSNVYTVHVRSGVYYEEPFTIPSYVAVRGESSISTIIQATYSNQNLVTLSDQSAIFDVQIQGCTGVGVAAVVYSSPTTPQTNAISYVENVRFGENYTHARVVGTGSGNCIMQCSNVKYGGYPFTIGFQATNNGSGIGRMQLRNVTSTNGGITTTAGLIFAKADATGCGFIVNGCLLTKAVGAAAGIGFQVENGGFLRLTGVNFQRWSKGIYAPDDVGTPSIDAIALNFENNTVDVQIDNTKATGKIQGPDNYSKTLISSTSSLYVVNKDQRRIQVSKKGGDFSSIKLAVDSITDSSSTNRYVIEVGPGEFYEQEIDLSAKPYISIVGSNIQTTQIFATSSSQNLIKMGFFNEISFLSLNNVGTGYAAILVDDIGNFAQAHKVSFYDCDTNIFVNSSTQDTIFYGEYLDFNGTFSYGLKVDSNNGYQALVNIENYYVFPGVTGSIANFATGTNSIIDITSARMEGVGDDYAVWIEDGADLGISATNIKGYDISIYNPNVGQPVTFDIDGTSLVSNTWDIYVDRPYTFGSFQGSSDHTRIYKDPLSNVSWAFLDMTDGELDITKKLSLTFDTGEHVDLSTLLLEGSTMGILSGGVISSVSGLTVSISTGYGYLETNTGVIKRVDWSTSQFLLSNNSSEYIYINENEILTSSSTLPDITNNIVIGKVATYNNEIVFIDNTRVDSKHTGNKLNLFNRKALGSIYESGSIVTSSTFSINVTSGSYYFGEGNFTPTGGSGITFSQFYRDGVGGWIISSTNSVTSNYDNNTGSLITMSASYFTKHTLYVVGDSVDEKYLLVAGQTQYQNLVDVENASLPTPPTYFEDGVTPIASIYVRQGTSSVYQVEDIRPVIGFKSSGVNATSLHSNLLGLSNDDHTQYLRVDGFRSMTDDLQMGSNSITGVDLINGVNITSHASRHLPNGSDPLSTGVPSNVGTSNQEGIQNAFARQDHIHALGTNVVDDSNIQSHTSSKITIVNKSQLNSSIVYTDQANTFGTFSNVFKSSNLSLSNTSNTFNYTFVGSGITANRNITLPLLVNSDTFVFENHIQTLTNKTLTSPILTNPTMSNPFITGSATFSGSASFVNGGVYVKDSNDLFSYILNTSAIAANRNITLPLLVNSDTFVFENHIQTLTNKTLTSPVINGPTISNPVVTGIATFSTIIASGSTTSDLVRITQTGTGNALVVEDSTNPDSSPFVIDQLGNVGIGTTSPGLKLDVYGDIASRNGIMRIISTPSNVIQQGPSLYLNGGTNSSYTQLQQGIDRFILFTFDGNLSSWRERMTVESVSGNIGIGLTAPDRNLDVTGNTRTVNLQSTSFATFSRAFILDTPTGTQVQKLALNSQDEVIQVAPYQKVDLYMNNNTTTTIVATNSWVKITGVAAVGSLSSNSFTYSSSAVTLLSATGDGGFESSPIQGTAGFAANGWTLVNGASNNNFNKWYIGTTGASGSGYGAYISNNNGASNAYSTGSASSVFFYRDVVIPGSVATVTIKFSVRVTGEATFDRLRVYLTDSTFTPAAGTDYTGQLGTYDTITGYALQTITTTITPSSTTQSKRLIFGWRNDTSVGTQPPASVDNISVTYDPAITLTYTGSQSTFKSTFSGSLQAAAGIASVGVQLAKNDGTASNVSEASFSVSTNYKDAFTVQNTFTLSNGDTVAPYINNKSSNTSVTFNDIFLNLIQID